MLGRKRREEASDFFSCGEPRIHRPKRTSYPPPQAISSSPDRDNRESCAMPSHFLWPTFKRCVPSSGEVSRRQTASEQTPSVQTPAFSHNRPIWCAREDLNLQSFRNQILSLARLPFRHARVVPEDGLASLKPQARTNLQVTFKGQPRFLNFQNSRDVFPSGQTVCLRPLQACSDKFLSIHIG